MLQPKTSSGFFEIKFPVSGIFEIKFCSVCISQAGQIAGGIRDVFLDSLNVSVNIILIVNSGRFKIPAVRLTGTCVFYESTVRVQLICKIFRRCTVGKIEFFSGLSSQFLQGIHIVDFNNRRFRCVHYGIYRKSCRCKGERHSFAFRFRFVKT